MRLAKATDKDFSRFWSIYRCAQRLKYADKRTRDRCQAVMLGRVEQLGGGFTRVVMGCQVLIDNACDPALDYLDFKPEIKVANDRLEYLEQTIDTLRQELQRAEAECRRLKASDKDPTP